MVFIRKQISGVIVKEAAAIDTVHTLAPPVVDNRGTTVSEYFLNGTSAHYRPFSAINGG